VLVSFLADMAAALVAFAGLTYWNERSAVLLPRKTWPHPYVSTRKQVIYRERNGGLPYGCVMTMCLCVQKSTGDTQPGGSLRSRGSRLEALELRDLGHWLLEAQGDQGIDARGAARGEVASEECDGHQQKRDGDIGDGVPDADAVEQG
jgi:hypothetical protein